MIKKLFYLSIILFLLVLIPKDSESQIISTTGTTSESASQLVYYYSQDDEGDTIIQVTNSNDTEGVWIHVQIFRSFDLTEDPADADLNKVICDERDFVDFLTPNDTHIYDLDVSMFPKNIGETATAGGQVTTLTAQIDETLGFIIITPVVSDVDFTAISFQNLFGTSWNDDEDDEYILNAMGRDAVDFASGEVLPDGTPLDGTTNGFVVLQPEELFFIHGTDQNDPDDNEADVVGIVFNDVYGPPGLLGYSASPGSATWTPFFFDFIENPTSCGMREVSCFLSVGFNDTLTQHNEELNPNQDIDFTDDDLLCPGIETPEYPIAGGTIGVDDTFEAEFFGWTRIFISGLSGFENHIGAFLNEDVNGMYWMKAN